MEEGCFHKVLLVQKERLEKHTFSLATTSTHPNETRSDFSGFPAYCVMLFMADRSKFNDLEICLLQGFVVPDLFNAKNTTQREALKWL